MEIKPLKDQVLIKVDLVEEKSKGGLYLVPNESEVKSSGIVTAIGDHPIISVKVGDHVLFEKSMGRRFNIPVIKKDPDPNRHYAWTEQEPYILVSFYDIIALLEDE